MVWYGFDSDWETVQGRKQRLKQYNLDDLEKQLGLYGITRFKEKGQKSDKKIKEFRKHLMQQMKLAETEWARKSLQVRETRKPELNLVVKEENGLGQEFKNTQDKKQSLDTPTEPDLVQSERDGEKEDVVIMEERMKEEEAEERKEDEGLSEIEGTEAKVKQEEGPELEKEEDIKLKEEQDEVMDSVVELEEEKNADGGTLPTQKVSLGEYYGTIDVNR